jgi:hypothetical protein
MICGDSSTVEQPAFLLDDGGAIPTSPLHVREIDFLATSKLVSQYHYLGKTKFLHSRRFGLYENGILVGAAVFGNLSAPETAMSAFNLPRGNYKNLLELHRFVMIPSHNNSQNSGSFLLGRALRVLKKDGYQAVISYADSNHHVGYLYQAANFTYHGLTSTKCDYYINGKKQSRGPTKGLGGVWKRRPQKHRYIYLLDKNLTIAWPKQKYPKHKGEPRNDLRP